VSANYLPVIEVIDWKKPIIIKMCKGRKCYLRLQNVKKHGYLTYFQCAKLLGRGALIEIEADTKIYKNPEQDFLKRCAKALLKEQLEKKTSDELLSLVDNICNGSRRCERGGALSALSCLSKKTMRSGAHSNQGVGRIRYRRKPDAALPDASLRTTSNWYQELYPQTRFAS